MLTFYEKTTLFTHIICCATIDVIDIHAAYSVLHSPDRRSTVIKSVNFSDEFISKKLHQTRNFIS